LSVSGLRPESSASVPHTVSRRLSATRGSLQGSAEGLLRAARGGAQYNVMVTARAKQALVSPPGFR